MKIDLIHITPYFLFFFGIIITYIGWSTKKILENIEEAIKATAHRVELHDQNLSEIISIIKVHDIKIETISHEMEEIKRVYKL